MDSNSTPRRRVGYQQLYPGAIVGPYFCLGGCRGGQAIGSWFKGGRRTACSYLVIVEQFESYARIPRNKYERLEEDATVFPIYFFS